MLMTFDMSMMNVLLIVMAMTAYKMSLSSFDMSMMNILLIVMAMTTYKMSLSSFSSSLSWHCMYGDMYCVSLGRSQGIVANQGGK